MTENLFIGRAIRRMHKFVWKVNWFEEITAACWKKDTGLFYDSQNIDQEGNKTRAKAMNFERKLTSKMPNYKWLREKGVKRAERYLKNED